MYSKMQKVVAFIICIAIVFVSLFSSAFIAKEANHDCTGHDCPICAHVREVEQTIDVIGGGLATVTIAAVIPLLLCACCIHLLVRALRNTLVSQKVRMNN